MLQASCHCGAIRLKIKRKPRTLTECNCSICRRLAARWAYYATNAVEIHCEPDALQAYLYKTRTYEYNHCKVCGCVTHYLRVNTKHNNRIAINARMMDPDDLGSIRIKRLDVRKPSRRRA